MDAILTTPAGHRLQGRALKRWWQLDDFFSVSLRRNLKEDKFRNSALQGQLQFLMTLPFGLGLYTYIAMKNGPIDWSYSGPRLSIMAVLLVPLIINFALNVRRHGQRVLETHETEDGLILKSLFLKRTITWSQIRDFFFNQDEDLVLETTSGEEFILSNELTDSAKLFELIKNKAPKVGKVFSYNYRLPNEVIDSAGMACLAVIVAALVALSNQWTKLDAQMLPGIIACLASAIISAALWKFFLSKVARLVRMNNSSCYIRTGSVSQDLMWEQLKDVKRFGPCLLVKSRTDWFLILADKKAPLTIRLLECTNRTKSIVQK